MLNQLGTGKFSGNALLLYFRPRDFKIDFQLPQQNFPLRGS
jgi:hypothetical protein